MSDDAWQDAALCKGIEDPEVFFPAKGQSSAEARVICQDCPVRIECLNYALRGHIIHGVWGGMSDRERARLRRLNVA